MMSPKIGNQKIIDIAWYLCRYKGFWGSDSRTFWSRKINLAIGLIALGAYLVADDQCEIKNVDDGLIISKPASLPKSIEMRGIGLVSVPMVNQTYLNWIVNMDEVEEARMPGSRFTEINGHKIPTVFAKEMQDIAFRVMF